MFQRLSLINKNDLFESNNICLIQIKYLWTKYKFVQIKFCFKLNKWYFWPYANAIICSIWSKIYFIQTNIYLAQRYFVWIKWMLFNSNESFIWIKKAFQTNYFLSFNQIFFLNAWDDYFHIVWKNQKLIKTPTLSLNWSYFFIDSVKHMIRFVSFVC